MRQRLIAGGLLAALALGPAVQAAHAAAPAGPVRPAAKPAPKPAAKSPPKITPKPMAPAAPTLPPEAALREARRLNDEGDNAGAYAQLKALIASSGFRTLSVSEQHAAQYLMGGVAMNGQKYAEAHAAFRAATDSPAVTGMDWFARGATAAAEGDDADTVYSLTRLAKDFPAALILASDDTVTGALAAADRLPDAEKRRFDLLDALFDAHWKPKGPGADISEAWRIYAAGLMDRGQTSRAAAVIALRVGDPYSLAAMRADRRFDALAGANPAAFDVGAAARRELEQAKRAVVTAPLNLAPVNAEARALLRLGDAAEAFRILDNALVRALPDIGESPYRDQAEIRVTLDLYAQALMALGRGDEATAAMTRAAGLSEYGAPNVTQATALAWLLLRQGKPRDALTALGRLNGGLLTGPQIVAAEAAQACALHGLGDTAGARRVLDDMKTRLKDGAPRYYAALLCVGDLDAASVLVLKQLSDPMGRGPMLLALQDFLPLGTPTAFDKEMAARRTRILARPEVDMAVEKIGRVEAQPVTAPRD